MAARVGFRRYALSIQYHGPSFLGYSFQHSHEDNILPDGTDLRGYHSVEGRLRDALNALTGPNNYENIQVSSRTDRGVHALKNTLHVDIIEEANWETTKIHKGLNFHLSRLPFSKHSDIDSQKLLYRYLGKSRISTREIRVLNCRIAPLTMTNPFYDTQQPMTSPTEPWNARFSATERTYIYRVLHSTLDTMDWAVPFECDRSWMILDRNPLDLQAMQKAAQYLMGTHDFSSFRGANCQRKSPIVTLQDIHIHTQPYGMASSWNSGNGLLGLGAKSNDPIQLVTILFRGNAFLYRQIRNLTSCLVDVGRGRLNADNVREILQTKDRCRASDTAPAQGLYLVDVRHRDLVI